MGATSKIVQLVDDIFALRHQLKRMTDERDVAQNGWKSVLSGYINLAEKWVALTAECDALTKRNGELLDLHDIANKTIVNMQQQLEVVMAGINELDTFDFTYSGMKDIVRRIKTKVAALDDTKSNDIKMEDK